ncbi:hypothetical protein NHJ13051_005603 [Beauveria bassiana]
MESADRAGAAAAVVRVDITRLKDTAVSCDCFAWKRHGKRKVHEMGIDGGKRRATLKDWIPAKATSAASQMASIFVPMNA